MRIKRLQQTAARGAIPYRGTLRGAIQAPQSGCGAASAAEAPNRWAAHPLHSESEYEKYVFKKIINRKYLSDQSYPAG